jgi:hypothetical protein
MKRFIEQNWFELLLFVLSVVIAVGTLIAREDVVAESKANYFSIFLASAGFACSQFIIIFRKFIDYNRRLNTVTSCDYHERLYGLGILRIYPKRRKTEQEKGGYYYELREELNKLNSNNVQNLNKKTIKMIGVSFDKFFGSLNENNDDIPSEVWKLCKKMHFQVMICDPEDNSELDYRLKFINEEMKNYYKSKREDWPYTTKDKAPIFKDIKSSIDHINSKKDGRKIDLCKYKFSPYATMIIIDEHIYYTPNVLEYKFYVEEKLPPEFTSEFELSMCIDRKSEYGEKLEKLFDALWNYGNVPATDDSATEGKSNRTVFPWFK